LLAAEVPLVCDLWSPKAKTIMRIRSPRNVSNGSSMLLFISYADRS